MIGTTYSKLYAPPLPHGQAIVILSTLSAGAITGSLLLASMGSVLGELCEPTLGALAKPIGKLTGGIIGIPVGFIASIPALEPIFNVMFKVEEKIISFLKKISWVKKAQQNKDQKVPLEHSKLTPKPEKKQ
jgi:hypothetical protein